MSASITIAPAELRAACSACNLRELCLPVGLSMPDLERLDALVAQRRLVPRGEDLFRAGERFNSVYAVRTGFFKTGLTMEDGREQVTGFQMTANSWAWTASARTPTPSPRLRLKTRTSV